MKPGSIVRVETSDELVFQGVLKSVSTDYAPEALMRNVVLEISANDEQISRGMDEDYNPGWGRLDFARSHAHRLVNESMFTHLYGDDFTMNIKNNDDEENEDMMNKYEVEVIYQQETKSYNVYVLLAHETDDAGNELYLKKGSNERVPRPEGGEMPIYETIPAELYRPMRDAFSGVLAN